MEENGAGYEKKKILMGVEGKKCEKYKITC